MVNVLSVCFSTLFLSNLALAAYQPHVISNKRGGHGRIVNSFQRRAHDRALEDRLESSEDFVPAVPRKRASGRCSAKTTTTSTSALASTTTATKTSQGVGNPGGDPTTTTSSKTTTTKAAAPTTTKHTSTSTVHKAETTTTSKSSGGGGSGTTYSGQGTYYDDGLGSCGFTNTASDLIAAVSHTLYDSWPGATANPNDNPICGKYATAHYGGKSVTVKVVDRCTGCAEYDLDFSRGAFDKLASESLGRIDITWQWD